MPLKFSLHPVGDDPSEALHFALRIADPALAEAELVMLGGAAELHAIRDVLDRFLRTGEHGAPLDDLDERLGWQPITVAQAVEVARLLGQPVTAARIRRACARGAIAGAARVGRGWRILQPHFIAWLNGPEARRRPAGTKKPPDQEGQGAFVFVAEPRAHAARPPTERATGQGDAYPLRL